MVTIKTLQEIKVLKTSGRLLGAILQQLADRVRPGVTTAELDRKAEELIRQAGGVPSFKGYRSSRYEPPFLTTICASVNEELVHTPASSRVLRDGDILSIDIGMRYPAKGKGLFTDTALTVAVGTVSPTARRLIAATKTSLERGIEQVKPGNRISDISRAVQRYVEASGFSVIRQLVGHGVGYAVHEEPRIPNFFDPKHEDLELRPGLVIAIEPMVSAGDYLIKTLDDCWTIVMADGSLSAHFEHTVAVTEDGVEVLTDPSNA